MIYVFIKPVNIEDDFEHVLMTNNEGAVRDYSSPISNFTVEIAKWVGNTRKGRVVCNVQGIFGVVLDDPGLIADLKIQLDKWRASVPLCVGVAGKIFDAYKAMIYAESDSSDSMVFYDSEVEKAFEEQVEDKLFKAESDQGGGNDYRFDLPQLQLDQEKGEEDKKASGASKKKILDVLMELKEKAPAIAQLKQIDPSAFKAINKLVESLGQIAQQGLIKKESLEKAWPKPISPTDAGGTNPAHDGAGIPVSQDMMLHHGAPFNPVKTGGFVEGLGTIDWSQAQQGICPVPNCGQETGWNEDADHEADFCQEHHDIHTQARSITYGQIDRASVPVEGYPGKGHKQEMVMRHAPTGSVIEAAGREVGLNKEVEELEKLHEWKKPDGWVQDGKIVVANDRDLNTGKALPRIIRQGHAGVKMGPNGGAVGATKTPRER